jgi:hypothetical protein
MSAKNRSILLAIGAIVLSMQSMVAAQTTKPMKCSTAGIKGTYGAALQGSTNNGYLLGEGGQLTFDGKGTVNGMWIVVLSNGDVINVPATGSYSVSSGCLGNMTITPQGYSAANFNIVVDSTQRLEMIQTDSGTIEVGYALPQGKATCTTSGLAGVWNWNSVGYQIGVGPGGYIGRVNLLSNGKMKGVVTLSVDGQIYSDLNAGGTFTVGSDCIGIVNLTVQGQKQPSAEFVVVSDGSEILVPGALGSITASR